MIILISSIFEIISSLATSLEIASIMYSYTAVIRSFIFLLTGFFLISYSDRLIKYFSISFVSFLFSIEVVETVRRPVVIENVNNFWIVISARSSLAYLSRTTLLFFSLLIFIPYLIIYIRRTKIERRKYLATTFVITLVITLVLDGIMLLESYPIIDQAPPALTELLIIATVLIIMLLDPYFFVFFRGKIKYILVYREDGVLLADIQIQKDSFKNKHILIGNLLAAISNFGTEIIFHERRLDYIKFEEDVVIITPYQNIYAAVIGEEIHESIKGLLLTFLKKFYNEFQEQITRETYIVPNREKIIQLFMKNIGWAIL